MDQNIQRILSKYFSTTIRSRGKRYFKEGKVKNVEISKNFVSARVQGSEKYYVWIAFDENLQHKKMSCTCPYFEQDNCKHLAALFYYLNANNYFDLLNSNLSVQKDQDGYKPELDEVSNKKNTDTQNDKSYNNLIAEREFKNYFSPLINDPKKLKKPSKTKFDIAYGITSNDYFSEIFPLRLRLRIDGTVADKSRMYNINYNTIPYVDLKEKLIIDYLLGYDHNSLYLGYSHNSQNDLRKRQMFNDILHFFSNKAVYFKIKHRNFERVNVLDEPAKCEVIIDETISDLVLKLSIKIDGERIPNPQNILVILDEPLWIFANDKIFKVNNLSYEQLQLFTNENFEIYISKDYLNLFEKELLPKIVSKLPIVSNKYEIEELNENPVKKILLEESDFTLLLKVKFGYGNVDLPYVRDEEFTSLFIDNKIYKIKKDMEFENKAVAEIQSLYVKKISDGIFTPRKDPIEFLLKHFSYFEEIGFEILGQENLKKLKINTSKPKVSFNITSGID